ncbi:RdRP-domain-containing protein [Polychaeton citri CBS 116435]|uniref:RNA-dependent RNA polymerase n=1 Tax=Polychaeton citri CBS 116435 TaxID=1314669 RepID=A0A9P4Q0J8_9PEZI|nr:RdRP-domain-containing protein [Polychaeton citri CBS 116435]
MKKFETSVNVRNLEICGAAFNALPLFLNRPLIKLLEDLGVPDRVFLELQSIAVNQLKVMTMSPTNTITYLDSTPVPKAVQLGTLIRLLRNIDLNYHEDAFLYRVIEMSLVAKLQEMKYRGRIQVEGGYTLYGIVDETGVLKEGEIFVPVVDSTTGQRKVVKQARVAITRSPVMHPGDVQIVNAVDVPASSPLQALSNVVVFSQHGTRDLPSQLSGGDLDGDLYNVIYDPDLVPPQTYIAGDYPRLQPVELTRDVELKDMSEFFVKFMESDQLGMVSNIHLQLADQKEHGTLDPDCIRLAQMASTAVDYSKTGIPMNMKDCPRYNRCKPDFMCHSPHVFISQEGLVELQDEKDTDEDDDFVALGFDQERSRQRYYRSKKILGQLYRAINDREILEELHEHHIEASRAANASESLMKRLWKFLQGRASGFNVLYTHQLELARVIRDNYEQNLSDLLWAYGPTPRTPVTEQEAWAGHILGRQYGPIGKPLRELSSTLRDRFEKVVEYANFRIEKGDDLMESIGDDPGELYGEPCNSREIERFPRALACMEVAMTEPGMHVKELGELKSFRYIAAGAALREHERLCNTMPRYAAV